MFQRIRGDELNCVFFNIMKKAKIEKKFTNPLNRLNRSESWCQTEIDSGKPFSFLFDRTEAPVNF